MYFAALFRAAKAGDTANEIKLHCLSVWIDGIISYIHAYDPEKVILGGGILKGAAEIVPYIEEKVMKHAWTPSILFVFILAFKPESIRYLISKGRLELAKDILFKTRDKNVAEPEWPLLSSGENVDNNGIKKKLLEQNEVSVVDRRFPCFLSTV